MGFNEDRGDSLTVVNSSFAGVEAEVLPEIPLWKQPANIEMAKDAGKFLVGLVIILLLYLRLLKPMMRTLTAPVTPMLPSPSDDDAVVKLSTNESVGARGMGAQGYQENLIVTKQIAKENPKLVANVVTSWVSNNG
jgi:flagellar M-ring protein FliF